MAVFAASACAAANDDPEPTAAPATPATTAQRRPGPNAPVIARLRADHVPLFNGQGDFYTPPNPLPRGEPGDLIRVEAVARDGLEGIDTLLVMYHSRNKNDDDVAVTGLIAIPPGAAPKGGRPIISWAHGTSGLAPKCAPSRSSDGFNRRYVDLGYIIVATDYIGLGPPGRHPYLAGISEGRSVIDMVRALEHIPSAGAGSKWVAFGHSQGGHAAIFAAEIAPLYAPESELLGAVAVAPVGDLTNLMPYAASPIRGIGVMIVYGLAVENPDLHPEDYLTDLAISKASVIDTGCNGDIAQAYATAFSANDLLKVDPGAFEPARTILKANNPGQVATPVPILIVHGGADWIVPPERSKAIFDSQCKLGVTTERRVYNDADHSEILVAAGGDIEHWIADRFAGVGARSSCP
jgi:pimeloyl-ACP methyl ester carboxylesterase